MLSHISPKIASDENLGRLLFVRNRDDSVPTRSDKGSNYDRQMTQPTLLFQRSGRGAGVWFFGVLAIVFVIAMLASVLSANFGLAIIDFAIAAVFAAVASFFNQRELNQSLLLEGDRLIVRDGANDTIEIPINSAKAIVGTATGGDVAMLRTLDYGNQDDIMPKKVVMSVEHGTKTTELYCVKGLTPPKMRALRDEINAALVVARSNHGYPEPNWGAHD